MNPVVLCSVACLLVNVAVTVAAHRADGPGAPHAPEARTLTVLFDEDCDHCRGLSRWLSEQRQLVPLELVPAGSPTAWRRFPGLDHAATRGALTVVGEGGQVFSGDAAWIACLGALAEYRRAARRLATSAPHAGP